MFGKLYMFDWLDFIAVSRMLRIDNDLTDV